MNIKHYFSAVCIFIGFAVVPCMADTTSGPGVVRPEAATRQGDSARRPCPAGTIRFGGHCVGNANAQEILRGFPGQISFIGECRTKTGEPVEDCLYAWGERERSLVAYRINAKNCTTSPTSSRGNRYICLGGWPATMKIEADYRSSHAYQSASVIQNAKAYKPGMRDQWQQVASAAQSLELQSSLATLKFHVDNAAGKRIINVESAFPVSVNPSSGSQNSLRQACAINALTMDAAISAVDFVAKGTCDSNLPNSSSVGPFNFEGVKVFRDTCIDIVDSLSGVDRWINAKSFSSCMETAARLENNPIDDPQVLPKVMGNNAISQAGTTCSVESWTTTSTTSGTDADGNEWYCEKTTTYRTNPDCTNSVVKTEEGCMVQPPK